MIPSHALAVRCTGTPDLRKFHFVGQIAMHLAMKLPCPNLQDPLATRRRPNHLRHRQDIHIRRQQLRFPRLLRLFRVQPANRSARKYSRTRNQPQPQQFPPMNPHLDSHAPRASPLTCYPDRRSPLFLALARFSVENNERGLRSGEIVARPLGLEIGPVHPQVLGSTSSKKMRLPAEALRPSRQPTCCLGCLQSLEKSGRLKSNIPKQSPRAGEFSGTYSSLPTRGSGKLSRLRLVTVGKFQLRSMNLSSET